MKKYKSLCFTCQNSTKECNALFFGKPMREIIQGNDIIGCSDYKKDEVLVKRGKGAEDSTDKEEEHWA